MFLKLTLCKSISLFCPCFSSLRKAGTVSTFETQFKFKPCPIEKKFSKIPIAKYGGRHIATMLPGAGAGPELMCLLKEIFRYAGAPVDFEEMVIDPKAEKLQQLEDAITSIRRNGVAIMGNVEMGCLRKDVVSVVLRKELDLYVNVLNCKSYKGVRTRQKDLDIVIIKQNTKGEYSMLEHENVCGVVECMKVVTAEDSERVARYAFEYAKKAGRKMVTTIHKANIMKLTDGLFLETSRKIAKDYPEIRHNDMIIDNCCMQLVSKPHQFDVLVMPNLYGSIISMIACGLVGGPGLLSGKNFGDHYAVFEPGARSTAAAVAGKNIANPIAMLNSGLDMLHYLGHLYHAQMIQEAIEKTINEHKIHTPDIGGQSTTMDVAQNIIKLIQEKTRECNWKQCMEN